MFVQFFEDSVGFLFRAQGKPRICRSVLDCWHRVRAQMYPLNCCLATARFLCRIKSITLDKTLSGFELRCPKSVEKPGVHRTGSQFLRISHAHTNWEIS